MKTADRIRAHVVERYVDPARKRGEETVTVVARDVLRELDLSGDKAPSVCSALRAGKFCTENDLVLIKADGPKSKQSTTMAFTYRLPRDPATGGPGRNAVWDLLGAGKATFAALGGGERWLQQERKAFYESDGGAGAADRQGDSD